MKKLFFSLVAVAASVATFAQVDVDRPINLTNSNPSDAKVTGIKEVSAPQDAVSAEVVQSNALNYASDSGTTDAYEVTLAPSTSGAYTAGQVVSFLANSNNTGTATLDVDGRGPETILKNGSLPLAADDIKSGQIVTVIFDGNNFQMVSHIGNVSGGSSAGDPTLIYTTNGF